MTKAAYKKLNGYTAELWQSFKESWEEATQQVKVNAEKRGVDLNKIKIIEKQ